MGLMDIIRRLLSGNATPEEIAAAYAQIGGYSDIPLPPGLGDLLGPRVDAFEAQRMAETLPETETPQPFLTTPGKTVPSVTPRESTELKFIDMVRQSQGTKKRGAVESPNVMAENTFPEGIPPTSSDIPVGSIKESPGVMAGVPESPLSIFPRGLPFPTPSEAERFLPKPSMPTEVTEAPIQPPPIETALGVAEPTTTPTPAPPITRTLPPSTIPERPDWEGIYRRVAEQAYPPTEKVYPKEELPAWAGPLKGAAIGLMPIDLYEKYRVGEEKKVGEARAYELERGKALAEAQLKSIQIKETQNEKDREAEGKLLQSMLDQSPRLWESPAFRGRVAQANRVSPALMDVIYEESPVDQTTGRKQITLNKDERTRAAKLYEVALKKEIIKMASPELTDEQITKLAVFDKLEDPKKELERQVANDKIAGKDVSTKVKILRELYEIEKITKGDTARETLVDFFKNKDFYAKMFSPAELSDMEKRIVAKAYGVTLPEPKEGKTISAHEVLGQIAIKAAMNPGGPEDKWLRSNGQNPWDILNPKKTEGAPQPTVADDPKNPVWYYVVGHSKTANFRDYENALATYKLDRKYKEDVDNFYFKSQIGTLPDAVEELVKGKGKGQPPLTFDEKQLILDTVVAKGGKLKKEDVQIMADKILEKRAGKPPSISTTPKSMPGMYDEFGNPIRGPVGGGT